MTFSDVAYVCALLAAVVGVFLIVGAFLSAMAAFGAATLALSGVLFVSSRALAAEGGET